MATEIFRYYLQGREDAEQDFNSDDLDVNELARKVLAGSPIRELMGTAVTDLLAIDPHDGSEQDWIRDHAEDLEEDEVDASEAYKAWRRGWHDRATSELEDAVVEAMYEEIEEDEDEEEEEDEEDEEEEDEEAAPPAPTRRRGRR